MSSKYRLVDVWNLHIHFTTLSLMGHVKFFVFEYINHINTSFYVTINHFDIGVLLFLILFSSYRKRAITIFTSIH